MQGGLMDPIRPVAPHLLPIIADLEAPQNPMTAAVPGPVMDPILPILPQPTAPIIVDLEAQKKPRNISGRNKLTKAQTKRHLKDILALVAMSPIQVKLIQLIIEEF